MHIVGVVEIAAGLVVAVVPRFGGFLVAGWLAGIITSLLIVGGYADIALRDFGLMLGALTLARLSMAFGPDGERVTGTPTVTSNGHDPASSPDAGVLAGHR